MINDPANRKSFIIVTAETISMVTPCSVYRAGKHCLVNKPQDKVLSQYLKAQQSDTVEPSFRTNCNTSNDTAHIQPNS